MPTDWLNQINTLLGCMQTATTTGQLQGGDSSGMTWQQLPYAQYTVDPSGSWYNEAASCTPSRQGFVRAEALAHQVTRAELEALREENAALRRDLDALARQTRTTLEEIVHGLPRPEPNPADPATV
jgi:hypothetical protein